jgi:hypothetical protein
MVDNSPNIYSGPTREIRRFRKNYKLNWRIFKEIHCSMACAVGKTGIGRKVSKVLDNISK